MGGVGSPKLIGPIGSVFTIGVCGGVEISVGSLSSVGVTGGGFGCVLTTGGGGSGSLNTSTIGPGSMGRKSGIAMENVKARTTNPPSNPAETNIDDARTAADVLMNASLSPLTGDP